MLGESEVALSGLVVMERCEEQISWAVAGWNSAKRVLLYAKQKGCFLPGIWDHLQGRSAVFPLLSEELVWNVVVGQSSPVVWAWYLLGRNGHDLPSRYNPTKVLTYSSLGRLGHSPAEMMHQAVRLLEFLFSGKSVIA